MSHGKEEAEPFASRLEELQAEGLDDSLARLVWTTVLLRRMRARAIRAVRSEPLAPMHVVLARSRIRRRTR